MKKIMFNDRYGLTGAVLRGDKTMTRRLMTMTLHRHNKYGQLVKIEPDDMFIASDGTAHFKFGDKGYTVPKQNQPAYRVGEEVAIAQSYETLANSRYCSELGMMDTPTTFKKEFCGNGWGNKMFVKAEYMPRRIRITGIKVERLQDISDEDAMREGVFKYDKPPLHHEADMFAPWPPYVRPYKWDKDNLIYRCTARYAFAYLIDRISGRGTWQSNPWVYAYTFELIK